MRIGLFVIGDEILSGKRQDRHLPHVIELLGERGQELSWARFLGDDPEALARAIAQVHADGDLLLSCGGIGATPDDCTRQAAARALGVPIRRHAQAEALILAQYGEAARPNRVLMADFPEGAGLIPNPVNKVAGFFVGHCHFVPGFPEMAWPMLEWVLDQRYPQLRNPRPAVEYRLRVVGSNGEGDLLPLMEDTLRCWPSIKLSSLPSRGVPGQPRHIEFGFKGAPPEAAAAYAYFLRGLARFTALDVVPLAPP